MLLKKLFGKKADAKAIVRKNAVLAAPLTLPEAAKDEIFNAQPAHIQKILTVLARIARDTLLVGDILRRGEDLPQMKGEVGTHPIYCRDIEALFERTEPDGTKAYLSYAYTTDLKTMDTRTQVHLSQFFGRIMALNTLLSSANPKLRDARVGAVPAMLDRILLEALCFKGFFSSFAISRALLTCQNPDRGMLAQFEALVARTKADLADACPHLHDAGTAFQALPIVNQSLMVELGKRYEAGQILINGVYFDAKMGAHVLGNAVKRQAETLSA